MAQKSRVSVAPINTLSFGGSSSTAQRFPVASVNHRAPPIDYSQYIIEGSQNEKSEKQPENQKPVVELQTQEEEEDNFVIPDEEETDILPAVKHSRPRFPASYQIEISAYVILTLVVGGLYFIAYVVGLFSSRNLTQLIYHHYPRLDLKPGDFVNDRQSYFVILLAISASRMVVCFTTFWMLQPLSQSWKRLLNFILNLLFVVIDVLIVATLFISWGFLCNNGLLGFELCNDTPNRFCNVYQSTFPTRCTPEPAVLSSSDLHPTGAFFVLLVVECLLLLLGVALAVINRQLDSTAREYKIVSALKE